MNKQDEDKARELAIKSTRDVDGNGNEVYNVFVEAALQEIAAWKEQQMIEKALSWIGKNCIKYNEIVYFEDNNNVPTHIFHLENFIEDFKNYMEEN